MTWTAPKTWASGDVLTAADMNTYVRDNAFWLGLSQTVGKGAPIVRVRQTNAQTGIATNTAITFDVADIDPQGTWAISPNPSRVKFGGSGQVGYYLFGASARYTATFSSGVAVMQNTLRYNGTTVFASSRVITVNSGVIDLCPHGIYHFANTNDYAELVVNHSGWSNVDTTDLAEYSAVLWGVMLGGTNV